MKIKPVIAGVLAILCLATLPACSLLTPSATADNRTGCHLAFWCQDETGRGQFYLEFRPYAYSSVPDKAQIISSNFTAKTVRQLEKQLVSEHATCLDLCTDSAVFTPSAPLAPPFLLPPGEIIVEIEQMCRKHGIRFHPPRPEMRQPPKKR